MPSCTVKCCQFGTWRQNSRSFFSFPKTPELKEKWMELCGIVDNVHVKSSYICEKHFNENDFTLACRIKQSMGIRTKKFLRHGVVPSLNLPWNYQVIRHRLRQEEAYRAADVDTTERDELDKQRKRSKEQRQERQEKRDRKELVEKLLAEHEGREQAVVSDARTQDIHPSWRTRTTAQVVGPGRPTLGRVSPAAPSAKPSDNGPPSPADRGHSSDICSGSDQGGVKRPPAVAIRSKLRSPLAGRSARPVKVLPLKMFATAHLARPRWLRQNEQMLDRTKEILRLKLRVRRLEAKCLRALGGPVVPQGGADTDVGGQLPATAEQKATADSGGRQDGQEAPLTGAASTARHFGEEPLVILRNERASKLPSVLRHLRENQLSDSMATFMPSDLQEALDAHHRLKVQLLNLQAVMLRWAMTNKKLRDDAQKEPEEGAEESVRGARLRELLQLEAAVKAMFTPAQLRAIVREHDDQCGGDSTDKHRKHQWGEEDLRCMLELRAISSDKVIQHVREKMKIPLPTLKTAKLRCQKSAKLSEAYKEMLQKMEENTNRCDMCERQANTIDEVVDEVSRLNKSREGGEDSPFGRHFLQNVPGDSQDTAGARPKKRRRTAMTVTSGAKKKREPVPTHACEDASDSNAELSDQGMWGRIASSVTNWRGNTLGHSSSAGRALLNRASDPYGIRSGQRSGR